MDRSTKVGRLIPTTRVQPASPLRIVLPLNEGREVNPDDTYRPLARVDVRRIAQRRSGG